MYVIETFIIHIVRSRHLFEIPHTSQSGCRPHQRRRSGPRMRRVAAALRRALPVAQPAGLAEGLQHSVSDRRQEEAVHRGDQRRQRGPDGYRLPPLQ